jgi:hypothetical protein
VSQQFIAGLSACACALFMQGAYAQDSSQTAKSVTPAADAAPELTAEKKSLIKQLLVLTDADKSVHTILDAFLDAQRKSYPRILQQFVDADTTLTDEQKKSIMDHTQERSEHALVRTKELFDKNIDMSSVMDNVAYIVYNKYFSADELKDIIAFYKTPTGKKTLKVMPDLTRESMEQARSIITPQFQKVIVQLIEEERSSLKAPPMVTK